MTLAAIKKGENTNCFKCRNVVINGPTDSPLLQNWICWMSRQPLPYGRFKFWPHKEAKSRAKFFVLCDASESLLQSLLERRLPQAEPLNNLMRGCLTVDKRPSHIFRERRLIEFLRHYIRVIFGDSLAHIPAI